MAKLLLVACWVTQRRPVHWEGENVWEKLLQEGWYRLYGKSSVYQTGPRAGRAVMQIHPALELLHHGPICEGVQEPELWLEVHGVILLVVVQEQGKADAFPHHGEGPILEIPARRVPALSRPASLTP